MKKLLYFLSIISLNLLFAFEKQIVVSELASRYEKLAAEELKYFLEQISPDTYAFVSEGSAASSDVIYLGQTSFARRHNIYTADFDREEFILRSVEDNLIISGGRPVGTLYGVYEFLEQLGVHFWTYDFTALPDKKSFSLAGYNLRKKPSLANRGITDAIPAWMMRKEVPFKYAEAYWRWRLRCRANGFQGRDAWRTGEYAGIQGNVSKQIPSSHNFHNYVSPEKYFAEHPEYFSMDQNGERFYLPGAGRRHGQLCLTNPDVKRITLEFLRDMIKKDREAIPEDEWPVVYDISAMDSSRFFCLCPNCEKITKEEGHAGLLLQAYINPIAEEIAIDYPELMIRTFAYSFAEKVPKSVRPAENVVIHYCDLYLRSDCYRPITSEFNSGQLEAFNSWINSGAKIYLWDYWNMGGINYFNPPRIETGIDAIIEDIKFFTSQNVVGIKTEYQLDPLKPQMFFALDNYVAAQLMYDVKQDPEMLIKRFMDGYYGAAAQEMLEVLNMIREGVKTHPEQQLSMRVKHWHFLNEEFLLKLWNLLEKAESKTEGAYRQHVQNEMITPLWTIISRQNETKKIFADLEQLKIKCRELSLNNLSRDEAKRIEGSEVRPTHIEQLEALLLHLPIPERFKEHPDKIKLFSSANFLSNPKQHCPVIDEPNSATGKAISYTKAIKLPFSIGVANIELESAKWSRIKIDKAPQDEKYHWYKIPAVEIGSKTWMYGFNGALRIELTDAYRIPAGVEDDDFNCYDIWFSMKFEGEAYVENSEKKDTIFIDYVVLTEPGLFDK